MHLLGCGTTGPSTILPTKAWKQATNGTRKFSTKVYPPVLRRCSYFKFPRSPVWICAGNRGGGKTGSLGKALLAIFNKFFRARYLRGVLQDRKRDPDWSKQEEARVFLFSEFNKRRQAYRSLNKKKKSRKKKHDYLSRLGLLSCW